MNIPTGRFDRFISAASTRETILLIAPDHPDEVVLIIRKSTRNLNLGGTVNRRRSACYIRNQDSTVP
jgi:hypothetical protein